LQNCVSPPLLTLLAIEPYMYVSLVSPPLRLWNNVFDAGSLAERWQLIVLCG
jgi:hypothetical protein